MTNQDELTMTAAKVLYGRLTIGVFPGGDVQKVAMIQVMLNELLDSERLSSNPAKVSGYTAQPDAKVALVNEFKADEERLLRKLDAITVKPSRPGFGLDLPPEHDQRWLAVARTHFQEGFMALNRAVFQPQRIKLPEDGE